jgi:DNA-binding transcriptional regulator GbsR (MarR family)
MFTIDNSKTKIISYLKSGLNAFTFISPQLHNEIPQMLHQLTTYYDNDEYFNNILDQIAVRWGNIFTSKLNSEIKDFKYMYNLNQTKLMELVKDAELLPDVQRVKNEQLDDLIDSLDSLMNPLASITRGIKKTKITKKLPSKKSK